MLPSANDQRFITMLKESISLMCKTSLAYDVELSVDGLLGITVDKKDILLVKITELFQSNKQQKVVLGRHEQAEVKEETEESDPEDSPSKKRPRRRRRSRSASGGDAEQRNRELMVPGLLDADAENSETFSDHDTSEIKLQDPELGDIVVKQELEEIADYTDGSDGDFSEVGGEGGNPYTGPFINMGSGSFHLGDEMPVPQLQVPVAPPVPGTCTSMSSTHQGWGWTAQPGTAVGDSLRARGHHYRCQLCPMSSTRRTELLRHVKFEHGGVGLHTCQHCQKAFTCKQAKTLHEKKHTGEGMKCSMCPMIFPSKWHLGDHMFKHSKKRIKCAFCPADFSHPRNLKKHIGRAHK